MTILSRLKAKVSQVPKKVIAVADPAVRHHKEQIKYQNEVRRLRDIKSEIGARITSIDREKEKRIRMHDSDFKAKEYVKSAGRQFLLEQQKNRLRDKERKLDRSVMLGPRSDFERVREKFAYTHEKVNDIRESAASVYDDFNSAFGPTTSSRPLKKKHMRSESYQVDPFAQLNGMFNFGSSHSIKKTTAKTTVKKRQVYDSDPFGMNFIFGGPATKSYTKKKRSGHVEQDPFKMVGFDLGL